MRSRSAWPCLAALFLACSMACGDDSAPAGEPGAERGRAEALGDAAQRLQPGADVVAARQSRAPGAIEARRRTLGAEIPMMDEKI